MPLLTEQAVIVRAIIDGNEEQAFEALTELEDQLNEAIKAALAGELDGNEMSQYELVLHMYGPDAEKLFLTVE